MSDRLGLLVILSSPSGAGKSTLARRLCDRYMDLNFSVSATTRAPRDNEIDGTHYHFLSMESFQRQVRQGEMIEHANIFGNLYGTPKAPVSKAIESGNDVLLDVDWQGYRQIRDSGLAMHTVSVFLLPPSISELRRRLEERGKDSPGIIAERMRKSWAEISHWENYDYVLVNDRLEETCLRVEAILTANRLRRTQQTGLAEHVRELHNEFGALS